MPTYVKVPETNKVYTQEVIDSLPEFDIHSITPVEIGGKTYRLSDILVASAVDPFAFTTNIQNLEEKKIADSKATQAEIDKCKMESEAFVAQFPNLT